VPANRTFRIQVLRAVDSGAEVALAVEPDFHNVIGSLNSSGLVALVDATGLAAIIAAAANETELEGVVPLGSAARLEFLAPARVARSARTRAIPNSSEQWTKPSRVEQIAATGSRSKHGRRARTTNVLVCRTTSDSVRLT